MNPNQLLSIMIGGMVLLKQASAQCDGMGSTWGPGIGPPPAGCGGGGGNTGGGGRREAPARRPTWATSGSPR